MPKRCRLTVSEKLQIIEYAESNSLSLRAVAKVFNVGKSHVGEILRHRQEVKQAARSGGAKLKSKISLRQLQQQYGGSEGERFVGFLGWYLRAYRDFIDFCEAERQLYVIEVIFDRFLSKNEKTV